MWPNASATKDIEELIIPHVPREYIIPPSENREIYLGSRRSMIKRNQMEETWRGDPEDLKEGSLIATLASDNPLQHPFWIAKLLSMSRDARSNLITSITVHWVQIYHASAYREKYSLEMLCTGKGTSKKQK